MCVVTKIYKSRMPSIVQSLVLIFARLIQTNPKEIVTFLTETSIDNRISLKIVLDKWLLQQPLFRGSYTKTVTLSSLSKLLLCRDTRVETLMVIGYNPSHSNVNSEVNAPFKILSTLLRFLENESKPTKFRPLRQPVDIDPEDLEASTKQTSAFGGSSFGGYSMKQEEQKEPDLEVDSGKRMDTMGHDDYDDESDGGRCLDEIADEDKLDVNLDDIQDDENDEDAIDLSSTPASKQDSASTGSS